MLIGGNIGKNKITPNIQVAEDFLVCFDVLFKHVDYFVVNVSSPNTPGLRELQDKEPLTALLNQLKKENTKYAEENEMKEKPILLKIAPDLSDDQLMDIIHIITKTKIDGVIATNTTIERESVSGHPLADETGGLSGRPVTQRSTEVIRQLRSGLESTIPIIGVGGIFTAEDARDKLDAGASLVQLYTGLIYQGPTLVHDIIKLDS